MSETEELAHLQALLVKNQINILRLDYRDDTISASYEFMIDPPYGKKWAKTGLTVAYNSGKGIPGIYEEILNRTQYIRQDLLGE